jgi:hypothetical protein
MRSKRHARRPAWQRTCVCLAVLLLVSRGAYGQLEFEAPPINYNSAPLNDRVARLQERVTRGDVTLTFDEKHGYLRSVLEQLDVRVSSQMLVFSKTSFQLRRIKPNRPRAVYFNDDVYVGWVQNGDVVELSAADPKQGAIFYTLRQEETDSPRFVRDRGQCITCHASSRTAGVPGHLVRSVYAGRTGRPFYGSGTFTTDHRSPFKQRWGGWYVSGTHGSHRHMGNVTVTDAKQPEQLDTERGANLADLIQLFDVSPYLSSESDIVALMVLEHQTQMQNLITRAGFETRAAMHYDEVMNRAMDRPLDQRSDSTSRRIAAVTNKLVDYMLFVDEFQLQDPVRGTSRFAEEFTARGPFDNSGRTLRELELTRRLMKFPCSYLIYSEPFDHLPAPAKECVYRRLFDALTQSEPEPRFVHLTDADRKAILEILRETKTDLPDYWRAQE